MHYGSTSLYMLPGRQFNVEGFTHLVVGKDQSIRDHNILSPPYIEYDDLRYVIWRKRLTPFVDCIRFRFVSVEAHNRKFLFGSIETQNMVIREFVLSQLARGPLPSLESEC